MSAQPMTGNLAWAPLPAFEEVEILDRFNGVPTLGVFGRPGDKILFWRVSGYVPEPGGYSVWLYVPLEPGEEERADTSEPDELLRELVFNAEVPRWVTVGLAQDNRLQSEFRWKLPRAIQPSQLSRLVSDFAYASKSLQDSEQVQPEPPASLPPIVAKYRHDEAVMLIWQLKSAAEELKLRLIKIMVGMRGRGDEEGRRGA